MTMTPLDPPGPCAYGEVIDVVLSAEPALVAIEYLPNGGGGAWDVVYADGRFSYRYRDSTRDGTTFHIRPPGDYWPCPFRLHYEPMSTAPTGGQTWGVVYDLNLAVQPSQTMTAAGRYTIDGLDWWTKGVTTKVSTALVNGAGLQFTNLSASNLLMPAGGIAFTDRHVFFPLAQVPGYATGAPTIVLARMTQTPNNGVGSSSGPWIGLISSTNDAVSQLAAARASEAWAGLEQSPAKSIMWKLGTQGTSGASSAAGTGLGVAGIVRPHREFSLIVGSPWSGTWPTPPDLRTPVYNPAQATMMYAVDPPARANPGIGFYLSTESGMTGAVATIHGVRVLQPKVAA